MIQYKFNIYRIVDNFSRNIIGSYCSNNNQSNTIFSFFKKAIDKYSELVRAYRGYDIKNILVIKYVIGIYLDNFKVHISGRSVCNMHIKRI